MTLPNQCSPEPQTQFQFVSGVADPFALEYLPVTRGGRVDVQSAVDFGFGGAGIVALDTTPRTSSGRPPFAGAGIVAQNAYNMQTGRGVFSLPAIQTSEWWHITIWGQEVIRDITEDEEISSEEVIRASNQLTMLKARIRWTERPGKSREIIQDIGTGLEICVGPTTQIDGVEIMVPDPTSAPPLRPADFTTALAGDPSLNPPRYRFDSYVTVSAWCVYGSHNTKNGRYTQSVFLGRLANGVVVEQPIVNIAVPDNSRYFQVFSTLAANNNPAQWGFQVPPYPAATTFMGQTDFFGSQTNRVELPQNIKFVRLSSGAAQDERVMTAVFEGQQ